MLKRSLILFITAGILAIACAPAATPAPVRCGAGRSCGGCPRFLRPLTTAYCGAGSSCPDYGGAGTGSSCPDHPSHSSVSRWRRGADARLRR